MLDTLTLSHSCGCSTVPKKNTELLKAKVRKAVRFENQTQARAQADCGLWHSWRDTEPAEVSCPLTSLPAIETWSHDLTSPPPSRGITTASLFHYLNPYYSAVQLYLHKKKNYHYKGAAFRLHRCINFWRLYISSSVQNPSHAAHSGWSQGFPNTKQWGVRKYQLFWGRLDSKIETHWLRIHKNLISRTMATSVLVLFCQISLLWRPMQIS